MRLISLLRESKEWEETAEAGNLGKAVIAVRQSKEPEIGSVPFGDRMVRDRITARGESFTVNVQLGMEISYRTWSRTGYSKNKRPTHAWYEKRQLATIWEGRVMRQRQSKWTHRVYWVRFFHRGWDSSQTVKDNRLYGCSETVTSTLFFTETGVHREVSQVSESVAGRFRLQSISKPLRFNSLHINILPPYTSTKRNLTLKPSIMEHNKTNEFILWLELWKWMTSYSIQLFISLTTTFYLSANYCWPSTPLRFPIHWSSPFSLSPMVSVSSLLYLPVFNFMVNHYNNTFFAYIPNSFAPIILLYLLDNLQLWLNPSFHLFHVSTVSMNMTTYGLVSL